MNISSIIVKVDLNHWEKVISDLRLLDGVEVHICDKESTIIILTITAEDVGKEIARLKDIEQIQGVLSANMHYSYSEEEFKILSAQEVSKNIEKSEDAKEIRYKGSVSSWLGE
ncbi:hypothetical protein BKH41_05795 [Helicobacter sp. 12S02232-10]|uniref:chaperone NapD n=1 Tax=Helicobacter sp. 12S02232-10 TaxID=1476197 RepID=UPI000BA72D9F|nr:chaperone NapD [Helicobacter sp. 12S02232-10]PAF48225.1 hypothetical protein BKH41_05795 [Helicobacter sp. 12S02232-10]